MVAQLLTRPGLSACRGHRETVCTADEDRAAVSRYQESGARHGPVAIEEPRATTLARAVALAHIAQLAKRLIGEAAKAQQLELQLMSNNTKGRRTISVMALATRGIDRPDLLREIDDPWMHLQTLRRQVIFAFSHAMNGG